MGFGPAQGPFDQQRVDAKQAELDAQELNRELVSKTKYDDKLSHEQDDGAASRRPGPLARFKRWLSARF
jgi:hypothetical protein